MGDSAFVIRLIADRVKPLVQLRRGGDTGRESNGAKKQGRANRAHSTRPGVNEPKSHASAVCPK